MLFYVVDDTGDDVADVVHDPVAVCCLDVPDYHVEKDIEVARHDLGIIAPAVEDLVAHGVDDGVGGDEVVALEAYERVRGSRLSRTARCCTDNMRRYRSPCAWNTGFPI